MTNTIVLVGFMGAGKTTVGRALAERLGWEFVDVDAEAERRSGRTIRSFFDQGEEAGFRSLERALMVELVRRDQPTVIATGGGWGADPDRVRALQGDAHSIWLRVDPEVAVERASGEGGTRPLLDVADPAAEARALLARRLVGYSAADTVIETDGRQPGQIVGEILDALGIDASPSQHPRT